MNIKLSKLKSPVLAGVVREQTARSAIAEIINCSYDGAGMIDLHLSALEKTDTDTLRTIIDASPLPVLALNYNQTYNHENAGFDDEEERMASMIRAIEAGAAGLDMQGYTFDTKSKDNFCGEDKYSFTKGNPKEIVTDEKIISKQCELIEKVHSMGAEVLLSCHPGIAMNTEQIVDLALFMEKRNPDIIKIVSIANNEDEMIESLKAMIALKREVKTPVTYHAGGKAGNLSRIVNPILGSHMLFCIDTFNAGSNIQQPCLRAVKPIMDNMERIL